MIQIERHDHLTAEVHAIRRAVFMEEQGISEAEEFDGTDPGCTHWLLSEDGQASATLRTRIDGDTFKIGRVATLATARGRGHAGRLLQAAIDAARQDGLARVYLSAQMDVAPWYARFGFVTYGSVYDDAGIPHIDMELRLAPDAPQ
ncbi:MAG: GNAT family N-acetyltransferase [Pseudomonadota bacterium]